jgi:hypothetical protein
LFASENSTLTTTTLGFLVSFLTARRQACLSLLRTSLAETAFDKVRAAKHTAAEMMIRCIEFIIRSRKRRCQTTGRKIKRQPESRPSPASRATDSDLDFDGPWIAASSVEPRQQGRENPLALRVRL